MKSFSKDGKYSRNLDIIDDIYIYIMWLNSTLLSIQTKEQAPNIMRFRLFIV